MSVSVERFGQGQDLVLLHGWGMNQGVWRAVVSQFEHKVSLLTPDLPGFGLSQQYPMPYQLDADQEIQRHLDHEVLKV